MAYFLKKSNYKKGTYLQIYESFYDPERKGSAHKSYKAIGYVHELIQKGIDDPVAFYQAEVDKLNKERKEVLSLNRQKQISDKTPEKLLGYFPIKSINDHLGVKGFLDIMQSVTDYRFNVYDLMSALIYARVVHPCSKARTFSDILPQLPESADFSLDQVYSCVEYIGSEYEKVIEIYNHQINKKYPFDTSHTYFDCTNFYFEIDREDDFRKKGPSKENRKDPIVGMGLLLDANRIPIGMKLFPGNESEKPVIRGIIDDLKKRNQVKGRTIQVADKGLNCGENIYHALKAGDGYLFSKSVKQLPEKEKEWILLTSDYQEVKGPDGKTLYWFKECTDDFTYTWHDENGRKCTKELPEKRVVTYNPSLAKKKKAEIMKQVEKAKALKASHAKKSEYGDCGKYISFEAVDKKGEATENLVKVSLNRENIEKDLQLAGFNLLVTSELELPASEIYTTYHNLWRIEESFRVMKSELDARPVYLQNEDSITGHFLICYLAVLLTRLFQFKVLGEEYSSETLFRFFRDFKVAQISERKYINLSRNSDFIHFLSKKTGLPLTSYFLTDGQVRDFLRCSI